MVELQVVHNEIVSNVGTDDGEVIYLHINMKNTINRSQAVFSSNNNCTPMQIGDVLVVKIRETDEASASLQHDTSYRTNIDKLNYFHSLEAILKKKGLL